MKYTKIILSLILLGILIVACGSKPEVYNISKNDIKYYKTIAILPFSNYSGEEDAGKQLSNAFLIELLKKPNLYIIEPGQVDQFMRQERIRSAEQIDIKTANLLRDSLAIDYILIGAVNEYSYIASGDRQIPLVGFNVRLLDANSGGIIWAANHSRKGDDSEFLFNWGLTTSLTKLAQKSVRDVVSRLKIER
jgi:TolB-like protein